MLLMDLDLALWQINPAAEYRLTDDKTQVLEWRGPGPQPTTDQLTAAWTAYQAAQATAEQQAATAAARQADAVATIHAALTTLGQPDAAAALLVILPPPPPDA